MLSLARRRGGIFKLVLNVPMLSLSIADHTNWAARAETNVCLGWHAASLRRNWLHKLWMAAAVLAGAGCEVRCLCDFRGNYAAGVVMQHQCPPTRRLLCLPAVFADVQIIGARLLFPTSWRLMLSLVAVGWRQESWHPPGHSLVDSSSRTLRHSVYLSVNNGNKNFCYNI